MRLLRVGHLPGLAARAGDAFTPSGKRAILRPDNMLRQAELGVERVMTPQIKTNDQADNLTEMIGSSRWRFLVLLALEVGRPLAFPVGQLIWLAQPTLSLFWASSTVSRWAILFEQPEQLDRLIADLHKEVS